MERCFKVLALALSCLTAGSGVGWTSGAQQTLVSEKDIEQAIRSASLEEQAQRETIRSVLGRDEVRRLATHSGIGLSVLEQARAAAGTLEGTELEEAAAYASELDARLAGGETVSISISLVALLLIIILVLVLAH